MRLAAAWRASHSPSELDQNRFGISLLERRGSPAEHHLVWVLRVGVGPQPKALVELKLGHILDGELSGRPLRHTVENRVERQDSLKERLQPTVADDVSEVVDAGRRPCGISS